jgi:hypothetical protein
MTIFGTLALIIVLLACIGLDVWIYATTKDRVAKSLAPLAAVFCVIGVVFNLIILIHKWRHPQ